MLQDFHSMIRKVKIQKLSRPGPVTYSNEEAFCGNSVELSLDECVRLSQDYMGDYLSESELGDDWAELMNAGFGYEWPQCSYSTNARIERGA